VLNASTAMDDCLCFLGSNGTCVLVDLISYLVSIRICRLYMNNVCKLKEKNEIFNLNVIPSTINTNKIFISLFFGS